MIRGNTERKLADVQDKISKLTRIKKSLQRLITACRKKKSLAHVPFSMHWIMRGGKDE